MKILKLEISLEEIKGTPKFACEVVDDSEYKQHLSNALDYYERNICGHEDTYRGGTIWTICSACGMQWADDRGGFKPHEDPPKIKAAREFLNSL